MGLNTITQTNKNTEYLCYNVKKTEVSPALSCILFIFVYNVGRLKRLFATLGVKPSFQTARRPLIPL